MSDASRELEEAIVSTIAPIIEEMEGRYPENAIAGRVMVATMGVIHRFVLEDPEVDHKFRAARERYNDWSYLQTLGSAIDRDTAEERASQALGQRIAALLDIDIQSVLRSRT